MDFYWAIQLIQSLNLLQQQSTKWRFVENAFLYDVVLSVKIDEKKSTEISKQLGPGEHRQAWLFFFAVIINFESNTTSAKQTTDNSETNVPFVANHVKNRTVSDYS